MIWNDKCLAPGSLLLILKAYFRFSVYRTIIFQTKFTLEGTWNKKIIVLQVKTDFEENLEVLLELWGYIMTKEQIISNSY